jgi:NAD dependent epimerase/dehydratase family enzyme
MDHLIEQDQFEAKVNICSPNPLPNREFMRALLAARGVRIGVPAPSWMIELGSLFLRTQLELVLKSRRVILGRLLDSGFHFHFPEWPVAAKDLVRGRS